uniref:NADH-ubiquinone oxidoreductase chain 4L n=1 Tax=Psyllaephagus populi TaxID=3122998 RepID=A0AAU7BNG0_9HYME
MFMFFVSLFMFIYLYNHLIITLIGLEFLMLSFLMLFFFLISFFYLSKMIMLFLIMVVCESVLGLTLLLILIRSKGNENMKHLSLLLW